MPAKNQQLAFQIVVTPEMVSAGLEEMRQHNFGEDLGYILESVFRAMAYESTLASAISTDR